MVREELKVVIRAAFFAVLFTLLFCLVAYADSPPVFKTEFPAPTDTARHVSDIDKPADTRPVVYVYAAPADMPCPPCRNLDHDEPNLPYRLVRLAAPQWLLNKMDQRHATYDPEAGYPTLEWKDAKGDRVFRHGWAGPENFAAFYAVSNPPQVARVQPKGSVAYQKASDASEIANALKFAGPAGGFVFTPDAAIRAALDDKTSVSYSKISGRYTIANGKAVIVFDQPLAHIDATKFFMHFGATLNGVEYSPPSATAVTNRGRFNVKLEPTK